MDINSQQKPSPSHRPLDRLLEQPGFYALTQKLNPFTVGRIRKLIAKHIPHEPQARLIDLGCGVGAYYPLLRRAHYIGIDINPSYIETARRTHAAEFHIMDAGKLQFEPNSFDAAVSIAMTHHLDDNTLTSMVLECFRFLHPDGRLHVIDAILPLSSADFFKRWFFMNDRGTHQRTLDSMSRLLGNTARIAAVDVLPGPIHDVAYFALDRRAS